MSLPPPTPPQEHHVVVQGALSPAQVASLARGGAGWEGTLRELPPSWSLGVVFGGPATGKTSLLRACFRGGGGGGDSGRGGSDISDTSLEEGQGFSWVADKAVVSQIGESPDENTAALHSCVLASVPAQLRPFLSLSVGRWFFCKWLVRHATRTPPLLKAPRGAGRKPGWCLLLHAETFFYLLLKACAWFLRLKPNMERVRCS